MDMEWFEDAVTAVTGSEWAGVVVTAVVILVITAVVTRILTKFLRRVLNYSDDLPSSTIFINIGRVVVWFLGLSAMLSTCFGVDVSAAVTALGIGGIAVSLGFQDTISNLIGGLQVSLLRIVQPGDNISVGGSKGVVKDVIWRHTTITNIDGETVVVPNSVINKNSLTLLPPAGKVVVPLVVEGPGADLNARAAEIEAAALAAVAALGTVENPPRLWFKEAIDAGFQGVLVFYMEDAALVNAAKDAALRAVAPLTRS